MLMFQGTCVDVSGYTGGFCCFRVCVLFQGTHQVDCTVSGYVCCFRVHIRWIVLFQGTYVDVSGYTSGGLCCFRVCVLFQGTHQVNCAVSGYMC